MGAVAWVMGAVVAIGVASVVGMFYARTDR